MLVAVLEKKTKGLVLHLRSTVEMALGTRHR